MNGSFILYTNWYDRIKRHKKDNLEHYVANQHVSKCPKIHYQLLMQQLNSYFLVRAHINYISYQ